MKTENGYYIDENNNRWDCEIYTEDQAKKNSESLIDCSGCFDCSRCSGYKSNPERYCKELIGTVTKLAQAYWTSGDDLQVIFGCYKTSSLEAFKAKAIKTNGKKKAKPFIEFADVIKQLTNKK